MIYIIVYTKETVVRKTECFNIYRWILDIMTVNVKLELTVNLLRIDESRHTIFSFIKQCQYRFIYIIVDKYNALLCTFNQVGNEIIGIINLTIVENTLLRLRITFVQSAENFFYTLVGLLKVLLHF